MLLLLVPLALAGCAHPDPTPIPAGLKAPFTGYESARYDPASGWLCRPDLGTDPCRDADLRATVVAPGGARHLARVPVATRPPADCFYVYPTLDMRLLPGNHTDFSDTAAIARTTLLQAGRFRGLCRLFVPLYRQATIGTYGRFALHRARYFRLAAADVEDAFLTYMARFNRGRPVVLIGHSQGSEMLTRLLKKRFDDDPVMRRRLLVALLLGARVTVAPGKATGGTFAHLPLCTRRDERGCVVTFRSFPDGYAGAPARYVPPVGQVSACVNPAAGTGDGPLALAGSVFPEAGRLGAHLAGVDTPYVEVQGAYAARCEDGPRGFRFLGISEVSGAKVHPVDPKARRWRGRLGLHLYDAGLTMGDLVDLVRAKIPGAK